MLIALFSVPPLPPVDLVGLGASRSLSAVSPIFCIHIFYVP